MLGPILSNIFLDDLLAVLKKSQIHNFADDNTISAEANSTVDLLKLLKEEAESAVKWFRGNSMILNPEKFQAIVLHKGNTKIKYIKIRLNIENISYNQHIKISETIRNNNR